MSERRRLLRFDGRAVLVVRAGSPIGVALAERFAAEGGRVHRHGPIATPEDRRGAVAACLGVAGALDVLVVPPHSAPTPMLADATEGVYREAVDAGLKQTYFAVQEAARAMPGGGRICVVAPERPPSVAAAVPAPATTVEGGLVALTRLLAVELAPAGIAVNALCPVAADADPADVAAVAVFLCSAEASYVTGAFVPALRPRVTPHR